MVEKIILKFPEYLATYKDRTNKQHLKLKFLISGLEVNRKILKTTAMQELAVITKQNESYFPQVIAFLDNLTAKGSFAMKATGKKLTAMLNKQGRY